VQVLAYILHRATEEEARMRTPSGQTTAPPLQALLKDGNLAGEWVLDPVKSGIGLKSRSMWGLVPVNGVFREVSGNGTVCADGAVSGTVTVAAASIETKNPRRDTHLRSADFFDSGTTRTSPSPRTVSGRPGRVSP
jgi:polyisoprenoid-binding protein YceI